VRDDVSSTLPTFAAYLAARRIDARREHAVFDQWDCASRDFTHPQCATARALILRWLTWRGPISRPIAEVSEIMPTFPLSSEAATNHAADDCASSDVLATEDA